MSVRRERGGLYPRRDPGARRHAELKALLARQPGPEVAEHVNVQHESLQCVAITEGGGGACLGWGGGGD